MNTYEALIKISNEGETNFIRHKIGNELRKTNIELRKNDFYWFTNAIQFDKFEGLNCYLNKFVSLETLIMR